MRVASGDRGFERVDGASPESRRGPCVKPKCGPPDPQRRAELRSQVAVASSFSRAAGIAGRSARGALCQPQPNHRLAARVVVSRDRGVGDAAVAVQDVEQVAVEAVDVRAGLRLAGVVGERGLVGDVDRDRMLEVDGALAASRTSSGCARRCSFPPAARRPAAPRHIHPGSARACSRGCRRASVLREQLLVRRVVLIDQEAVREIEADAAERVALARRLEDADRAVVVVTDLQSDPRQRARIARQRRQIFVADDRRRHVPGRIDRDVFHRLGQQRRGVVAGLADDDLGRPHRLAVLHHLQRVVGDVDHHIGRADVVRHPAPAFHVGDDGVGARRSSACYPVRLAPCAMIALLRCLWLASATFGSDLGLRLGAPAAADRGELGLQRLVLRRARIERVERGADIGAAGDLAQHIGCDWAPSGRSTPRRSRA